MRLFSGLTIILLALGFAPGASAQSRATARTGEGIYALLRRQGIPPNAASVAEFRKLNAALLGEDDRLFKGRRYRLPSVQGAEVRSSRTRGIFPAMHVVAVASGRADDASPLRTINVPLFGEEHRQVAVRESTLEGRVYYIVSGHGGPDPGTVGRYRGHRIAEDEIAYDTALRLARELMSMGATVHVIVQDPDDGIRDDEVLRVDHDEEYLGERTISNSHSKRLDDQATIVNELYDLHEGTARSQRLVSIHVDSRGVKNEPQLDVHFLYATDSGQSFGKVLRATISDKYKVHQPGRGYRGEIAQRENLVILKDTKPVAVLVELGNIGNRGDQQRLVRPDNRQALAEWIAEGLLKEAGVRKNV